MFFILSTCSALYCIKYLCAHIERPGQVPVEVHVLLFTIAYPLLNREITVKHTLHVLPDS